MSNLLEMQNHLAAFHRINPCVDKEGNRKGSTGKETDVPTGAFSGYSGGFNTGHQGQDSELEAALRESRRLMGGGDEELQRVLAASRQDNFEDAIMARVMQMSAMEAGIDDIKSQADFPTEESIQSPMSLGREFSGFTSNDDVRF